MNNEEYVVEDAEVIPTDTNLEGEDLDDAVDDDTVLDDTVLDEDDADTNDDDGLTEEDEDDADEASQEDSPQERKPLFDDHQQEEVKRIVKNRLARQEAKIFKDVSQSAGVQLNKDSIHGAARLWGLLLENPELSQQVDTVINTAISSGRARTPDTTQKVVNTTQQRLALKEAILDLRSEDKVFDKNVDKILAWAENEDYDVNDPKALQLAYLAWKGSQGAVISSIQKTNAKRKQANKRTQQKQATLQSTKSGASRAQVDYSKMSDKDFLASSGLKLFTDE